MHTNTDAYGGLMHQVPLELELQVVVYHLIQVLGTEFKTYARAVHTQHRTISPPKIISFLYNKISNKVKQCFCYFQKKMTQPSFGCQMLIG